MKHDLAKHFDYHIWANRQVFERLKSLPEDLFKTEIKSVFPSVSAVIIHMCVTDSLWLDIITGGGYEETKALAVRRNEELKEANIEKLIAFLKTPRPNIKLFRGA